MNAPATTHQKSPVAQLRSDLKAALPTFGLQDQKAQDRMSSVLMVAVERDNALLFADRQSLIAAVRQCANHGLVPDGNEAMLQVYNTKVKDANGREVWIKKVQYQPMVRGIINRVQKSGKIKTFWAEVVYRNEEFHIDASDGERRPIHTKASEFERGEDKDIIGAYSVAKFRDGTVDCEPMPLSEIQKVRAVAKTQKVWDGWFTEKAKVAVMRRHSKRLPLSAEDLDMILNRQEHDLEQPAIRDVTPEDRPNLAQRLQQQAEEPITGEILPDDEPETSSEPTFDEDAADPFSEAYDEGLKASQAGMKEKMNPHEPGTEDWNNWIGGFRFHADHKSAAEDEA